MFRVLFSIRYVPAFTRYVLCVKIIVPTCSLAAGINLPAWRVIFPCIYRLALFFSPGFGILMQDPFLFITY